MLILFIIIHQNVRGKDKSEETKIKILYSINLLVEMSIKICKVCLGLA